MPVAGRIVGFQKFCKVSGCQTTEMLKNKQYNFKLDPEIDWKPLQEGQ